MYQMDLFSIISFALAIASLFISIFMGILSWLFYSKSDDISKNINTIVSELRVTINNVESQIKTIVTDVVKHWLDSDNQNNVNSPEMQEITDRIEQLLAQLKKDSRSDQNVSISEQIQQLFDLQKTELSKIKDSLIEKQIQTIIPNINTSAVSILQQELTKCESNRIEGTITLKVNREVVVASGRGQINQNNTHFTKMKLELLSSPCSVNHIFSYNPGGITTTYFNIHINAIAPNIIPIGEYKFKYILS